MRAAAALLALRLAAPARAGDAPGDSFVLRDCRLEAGDGTVVDGAVVVVRDGRIEAAGEEAATKVPADLPVVQGNGGTVLPGFVLAATRLGVPPAQGDPGRATATETAADEIDPFHRALPEAARAGVAVACVVPGPGAPGGEGVAIRPAAAGTDAFRVAGARVLRTDVEASTGWSKALSGALEAARREIDQEEKSAREREAWRAAVAEFDAKKAAMERSHAEALKKHEEEKAAAAKENRPAPAAPAKTDPGKPPPEPKAHEPDARTAAVREAVRRNAPVVVFAGGAADAERALDLLAPWRLRLVFRASGDAWRAAPRLAAAGAWVLVEPETATVPGTMERVNPAAVFAAAGCPVAFVPRGESRALLESMRADAGMMVRYGLPRRIAIRALALEGARALGLDATLGTIAPGRSADLLLYEGDPLEPSTRLAAVWSAGRSVPLGGGHDAAEESR
jgi:imidazolonepropionase-like amidohydrolase